MEEMWRAKSTTRLCSIWRVGVLLFGLANLHAPLCANTIVFDITSATAEIQDSNGQYQCMNADPNATSCAAEGAASMAIVNNGLGGSASASVGATSTTASAVSSYFVAIFGPANVSVPILISGTANAQDNGFGAGLSFGFYFLYQGSSSGATLVTQAFGSPLGCQVISAQGFPCATSGPFTLNTTVTSDEILAVELEAVAVGENASVTLDPLITIDPTFPLANEFTVEANTGVFSASPEPASWGLIMLVLPVGFLLRRRIASVH